MTAVRRPSVRRPRKPPPAAAEGAASRIRPLLERYCKLAKVKLIACGADLYEMKLPLSERAHFSGRATVRVALSLEALEREPDAEMAVLGSPFLGALLEAIRTRAGRLSLGTIPLSNGSSATHDARHAPTGFPTRRAASALAPLRAGADARSPSPDGDASPPPAAARATR